MSLFCWVWVFWDFWWVFRELSFWFVCLCLVIFSLFGGWWGFFVLLWDFFFSFFVWFGFGNFGVFFLIWLQEKQLHLLNNYLLPFHFGEFRLSFLPLVLCVGFLSLHLQCLKFACPRLFWTHFIVKRPKQVSPKGDSSGLS